MMFSYVLRKDLAYLTILFCPLYTLYVSFKYYDKPYAKNLFWLVCCFLGFVHIVFPEGGSSADGTRYAEELVRLYHEPLTFDSLKSIFYEDSKSVDIYQILVTYIISFFTDSEHVLFAVFAFVFGFFYSRNIWNILDFVPRKSNITIYIFALFYILLCPIWNINGVRMWTALQIFLYGALPFFLHGNKSKLYWCFLSLFVHFSFVLPLVLLIVGVFIPKNLKLLISLFLFSFFIQEVNLQQVNSVLTGIVPSFLSVKVNSYANESYSEALMEGRSSLASHVVLANDISKYIVAFLLFYVSVLYKKKYGVEFKKFLCFVLFFYAISNLLSLIPSGGRFLVLAKMFAMICIIWFYTKNVLNMRKEHLLIFRLSAYVLVFAIIFTIRVGFDYYGIQLFFSPIISLFFQDNVPLIQVFKNII